MHRQGYHSHAPAIDGGAACSPGHITRTFGVVRKLRGRFVEATNRTAHLPGYRDRKAKLLWLKLKAGVLDPQTAVAVAREHAEAFARLAQESAGVDAKKGTA